MSVEVKLHAFLHFNARQKRLALRFSRSYPPCKYLMVDLNVSRIIVLDEVQVKTVGRDDRIPVGG